MIINTEIESKLIHSKMKSFIALFAILSVAAGSGSDWLKCGLSKYKDAGEYDLPSTKIVGGIEARQNEFPYIVALKRSATLKQLCAGTLLNEKWILTAAHCVRGMDPSSLKGVVGDHVKNKPDEGEALYPIEKVIIHPKYHEPTTWAHDFALLKVSGTIKLNENVWPACSPQSGYDYVHEKAVVSGWGTTNPETGPSSNELLYTTVNVTTNDYCKKYFPPSEISDDMLCTTDNRNSTERDACVRDSGGPLTVKQKNGQFALIGVISWGYGCAQGYPGVYSRVNYVEKWILDIMKSE